MFSPKERVSVVKLETPFAQSILDMERAEEIKKTPRKTSVEIKALAIMKLKQ